MERYNGLHPPFICSSCPKKTFGDCHSLLIHSVLAHDKAYVMELHDQASPSEPIDNSLVQLLVPQVPLVQPNVTESDEAVAEDVEMCRICSSSHLDENRLHIHLIMFHFKVYFCKSNNRGIIGLDFKDNVLKSNRIRT